ncbi:oligosaccharide flippase family protein [Pseudoalteromonas xiamenensis]|uniref:oligosaccharide flippase family protein n=1 Tax=Pseudoalteromonas xiamenensis TaxID=882626 RepID=UPI0027E3BCF4|nr:oligosaccharide flippase family protein [Pseudoalteromonas xiamenensis]WMN60706.1 oligosaccharide flippase family protein [Pseudoalteromonas xiamenensis]WMN60812.1 oligosaccharide flippase family protein [Pseudoalteromonas xiamenensis]
MSEQHNQYLSRGAVFLVISIFLGYAADYAFNLTLSRHLSVHEYGDYKVAYGFTTLMSVLVLLGGDRLAPRILARPISEQQTSTIVDYLAFYLKNAFVLSFIVIALTWAASFLYLLSFDKQDHHAMAFMVLAVPLIAVGAILSRVLQSAKRLAASNLPWRIVLPVLKALSVLLLAQYFTSMSVIHVIAAGIIVVIAILLWQFRYLKQLGLLQSLKPTYHLDTSKLLKLSIPMMLAMLVTMLLNQTDIFMLELISQEHVVGHFGAANTLAHLIPVTQVTIASLFMPLIGHYFDKQPDQALVLFKKAQRITILVIAVIATVLFIFSNSLLAIFGDSYLNAEPALVWLIAGYSVWAFAAPSVTWQQYNGNGLQIVYVGAAAIMIDLVANLYFIPKYDIEGAAIATALSLSCATVLVLMLNLKQSAKSLEKRDETDA